MLRPSWRSQQHNGGEIRFTARGYLVVAMIGHGVGYTSFTSSLMIAFVYAMMKLNSEHSLKRHTSVEEKDRGDDN